MNEPRSPSDKSVPPEAEAGRERLGRGVSMIWIGVLVVTAVLLAILLFFVA